MRHFLLAGLLLIAAAPLPAAPYIRIVPATAQLNVGDVLDVTIEVSTDTGAARGGAIDITFDPAVFEVVGGSSGITKDAASIFALTPSPTITGGGNLQLPFLKSDFVPASYTGPLAHFQLRALSFIGTGAITHNPASSRFSPVLAETQLGAADYIVITPPSAVRDALLGVGPPPNDQNGDGVLDIADLLRVF